MTLDFMLDQEAHRAYVCAGTTLLCFCYVPEHYAHVFNLPAPEQED